MTNRHCGRAWPWGASLNWDDDRYTIYGELLASTSLQDFGEGNAKGAKLGVRVIW